MILRRGGEVLPDCHKGPWDPPPKRKIKPLCSLPLFFPSWTQSCSFPSLLIWGLLIHYSKVFTAQNNLTFQFQLCPLLVIFQLWDYSTKTLKPREEKWGEEVREQAPKELSSVLMNLSLTFIIGWGELIPALSTLVLKRAKWGSMYKSIIITS